MAIDYWAKGLIVGFAIAVPVGPIGMLCIRRTLNAGRASGLITGIGAATADAIYGGIGGFGLHVFAATLVSQQAWLRLFGGVFLLCLGVRTFMTPQREQASSTNGKGLVATYVSTFVLTLTNPMTIFSFAAVFAALGIGSEGLNYLCAALLVFGVFCGSALWWLLLSGGVAVLRSKFDRGGLRWANRISGVIIIIFGLVALLSTKI
jgi:threonine/homoserine/homoserine lactone efflux protein